MYEVHAYFLAIYGKRERKVSRLYLYRDGVRILLVHAYIVGNPKRKGWALIHFFFKIL